MKTIFASRWKALWFFASVMLTAYCSIPEATHTPGDEATAQQQAGQVEDIMKHLQTSADNLKQFHQR